MGRFPFATAAVAEYAPRGSVAKFHVQRKLQRVKIMESMGYDSSIATENRLCDRTPGPEFPQSSCLAFQPIDLCSDRRRECGIRGAPAKLTKLVLEMLFCLRRNISDSPFVLDLLRK
jgi:hypothetical protein